MAMPMLPAWATHLNAVLGSANNSWEEMCGFCVQLLLQGSFCLISLANYLDGRNHLKSEGLVK